MIKKKFVFEAIALLFGFFIFATSVLNASQKEMHNITDVSEREFYFGTMLPDHLLYPVLMASDQTLLYLAQGGKKIRTRMMFASDRFQSAKSLLEKEKEVLALTTLTKSQKYLIHAALEYLDLYESASESERELLSDLGAELLVDLKQSIYRLEAIESEFKEVDTQPLQVLIVETQSLISTLLLIV